MHLVPATGIFLLSKPPLSFALHSPLSTSQQIWRYLNHPRSPTLLSLFFLAPPSSLRCSTLTCSLLSTTMDNHIRSRSLSIYPLSSIYLSVHLSVYHLPVYQLSIIYLSSIRPCNYPSIHLAPPCFDPAHLLVATSLLPFSPTTSVVPTSSPLSRASVSTQSCFCPVASLELAILQCTKGLAVPKCDVHP